MKQYCLRFNAYYDDYTGEWLEGTICMDPDCKRCKELPKLKEYCNGCHMELKNQGICQGMKTIQSITNDNELYLDLEDIPNMTRETIDMIEGRNMR